MCWIAEAVYGKNDLRVPLIRWWLKLWASESLVGAIVVALYRKLGQRIAHAVEHSKVLKAAFKPLFDVALGKAQARLEREGCKALARLAREGCLA